VDRGRTCVSQNLSAGTGGLKKKIVMHAILVDGGSLGRGVPFPRKYGEKTSPKNVVNSSVWGEKKVRDCRYKKKGETGKVTGPRLGS